MGKFIEKLNPKENVACSVSRGRSVNENLTPLGKWVIEIWGRRKSGRQYLKERQEIMNTITTLAKNAMFDNMFNQGSQVTSTDWCIGLVNNAGWTAFSVADTMASHTGWVELTGYSQSTRVAWTQGAASAAAITNASPAVFDINAGPVTVKGLFVTSVNTKGGTTGLLWSGAAYTSPPVVDNGDQIRSIYSLSM